MIILRDDLIFFEKLYFIIFQAEYDSFKILKKIILNLIF